MIGLLARMLHAAGRFWLDFLVGDTPEMLLAALVVVAVAYALRHVPGVDMVILPALVILVLIASAFRGRTRRR